jgi:hypothetical protein
LEDSDPGEICEVNDAANSVIERKLETVTAGRFNVRDLHEFK